MVKWKKTRERSDQLVDRRRSKAGVGAAAVGGGGIIALLLTLLLGGGGGGGDLGAIFDQLGSPAQAPNQPANLDDAPDPDAELVDFMSFVLDDVQGMWAEVFAEAGQTYEPAELVLFSGSTESACGGARSAIGPHYCPVDQRVYLDLDFFRELASRFDAPGDFAQAYVLAHEIAHHVQNVTGIMDEVRSLQQSNGARANEYSIALELQADCLSGIWGRTVFERDLLERGDLEEGLGAAAAVGDDRIQEQATGTINPETWTHGSSNQRIEWFEVGFDTGDPNACSTFGE